MEEEEPENEAKKVSPVRLCLYVCCSYAFWTMTVVSADFAILSAIANCVCSRNL